MRKSSLIKYTLIILALLFFTDTQVSGDDSLIPENCIKAVLTVEHSNFVINQTEKYKMEYDVNKEQIQNILYLKKKISPDNYQSLKRRNYPKAVLYWKKMKGYLNHFGFMSLPETIGNKSSTDKLKSKTVFLLKYQTKDAKRKKKVVVYNINELASSGNDADVMKIYSIFLYVEEQKYEIYETISSPTIIEHKKKTNQ